MTKFSILSTGLLSGALLVAQTAAARTITVSGKISTKIHAAFSVLYVVNNTSKSRCLKYNPDGGLWVPRSKSYIYKIDSRSGHYKIKLPLSKLTPNSYCKWRPQEIMYTADLNGATSDLYGSLVSIDRSDARQVNRINLRCKVLSDEVMKKPWLACYGLKKDAPGELITISRGQRSLVVNFTMKKTHNRRR